MTPSISIGNRPNTFLIGAPKSGTTALASYLSDHPDIFFSNPKEPFYWCTDFPQLREKHLMTSESEYLKLFSAATDRQKIIAEGSTNYLMSECAVASILEFDPNAKFIAMLRNPIELVYALHSTLLFTLNEDVQDFEKAWDLQTARSSGEHIPQHCLAPQFLQYRHVGALGSQVERFCSLVPESQRAIVLFDDLKSDAAKTYGTLLKWLDLEHDGRKNFPKMHGTKRQNFKAVHRFWHRPPRLLRAPVKKLRTFLRTQKTGIVPAIKRQFSRPVQREQLDERFRDDLHDAFADEIDLLAKVLGRDLDHWKHDRSNAGRQS